MRDKKIEQVLTQLPDAPGIYLFYSTEKELIYVGKATSLKQRVRSYFRGQRTPRPIEEMIDEVADIKWKEADSVLEAVILESIYIKKYQPVYNVIGKDNKSWNYIVITKEDYPRVETRRQYQMSQRDSASLKKEFSYVFGPYPGLNTRETMKLLRKLFYISSCQKKGGVRKRAEGEPCLYRQMGQCLGVCTGDISSVEYKRQVIRPLVLFLKGGKKRLISTLERRMKKAATDHEYETAARLRDQIGSLNKIHDVALLNKEFYNLPAIGRRTKQGSQPTWADELVSGEARIEGYDISNLGATGAVGSMVVFDIGGPQKDQYRKFKIKIVEGQSDVDCLEEVLRRRLKHGEWQFPSLFLIDGGKPQVNRAVAVISDLGIDIPVVGIAKGPDRKKNEFHFGTTHPAVVQFVNAEQALLVRVRDEAHRFAVTYQRQTRKQ